MIKLEFYFPKDSPARIVLPSFICHGTPPAAAPSRNAPGTHVWALSIPSIPSSVQLHFAVRGGSDSGSRDCEDCFQDRDVGAALLEWRCRPLPTKDGDVLRRVKQEGRPPRSFDLVPPALPFMTEILLVLFLCYVWRSEVGGPATDR